MVEFVHLDYCGNCGGRLSQDGERYVCDSCPAETYNSPVCGASLYVFRGSKVLLLKRGVEPNKGKISNPGGFLNFMEAPEDAARREFQEETGGIINYLELVSADVGRYTENQSVVDLGFYAELADKDQELRASDDAGELLWVEMDDVEDTIDIWEHKKAAMTVAYEIHKRRTS